MIILCEYCNNKFIPKEIRKDRPRRFCSTACATRYHHKRGTGCASLESRKKISKAAIIHAQQGTGQFSIGSRENMKNNAGRYWLGKGEELKKKCPNIGLWMKGRKASQATCEKKSILFRQGKNPNWQGGKTTAGTQIRASFAYRNWREKVFDRDDYTCQQCGVRGCRLHADHIKSFALYPELRLDIDNGRTLCVPCHKQTDTYLNKWATA